MRSLRPVAVVVMVVSSLAWADPPVASDSPRAVQLAPAVTPAPAVLDVTETVPLHKRWQVWTAVGVLAVATVVAAVVVASSNPPPPPKESQVCVSGRCDGCIGLSCAASGALKF